MMCSSFPKHIAPLYCLPILLSSLSLSFHRIWEQKLCPASMESDSFLKEMETVFHQVSMETWMS